MSFQKCFRNVYHAICLLETRRSLSIFFKNILLLEIEVCPMRDKAKYNKLFEIEKWLI